MHDFGLAESCMTVRGPPGRSQFKHFLLLQGECRGRSCHQPGEADGLTGFFAESVTAVMNSLQCPVDRMQMLTLAVAHPKLERLTLFK